MGATPMRRRFIADRWTPDTATLIGDQANHLARVLRAELGQIYDIVANGFLHRAEIIHVSDDEVVFALHEELDANAALPLHLYLAVFKFDHFEWAIEKATELGVSNITPILARRTEKHLAQAAHKRSERWRRIALEASKQSRRTDVPEIADPVALKLALEGESSTTTRILLSETEQSLSLTAALQASVSRAGHPTSGTSDRGSTQAGWPTSGISDVGSEAPGSSVALALAVGPEGGWTPEEMALFTSDTWQHVTLGPRILRAETAAVAAIAIASAYLA